MHDSVGYCDLTFDGVLPETCGKIFYLQVANLTSNKLHLFSSSTARLNIFSFIQSIFIAVLGIASDLNVKG